MSELETETPERETQRPSLAKRTDLGNAQRLVARYADLIRYVPATENWHIWNGARWAPDDTLQIQRLARATVAAMQREADGITYDEDAKIQAVKWACSSEGAARLASMVSLAQAEEGVAVTHEAFDNQPWELCVQNGIVDLKTGKLRGHDPAAMHSMAAGAPYLKGSKAPLWMKFVKLTLPDPEVRSYVQKLLGASLVGMPLPHATFPFVYGEGGTGKSTLLEPVLAAVGEYGRLAPPNLLVGGKRGEQTYDIAALRGARFVLASEGHSRQTLAEDTVKRITGDATLAGRQIREAEMTFTNVTALWFMSNHEPRVSSTDTGLWRRIKEIPMEVVLGPEHEGLKERMIADELPGILAWCIAGCVAWQRDGLQAPDAVTEATAAFRDDSNPLLEWLDACCDRSEDGKETGPDLHNSYVEWCTSSRRPVDYRSGRGKTWARALRSVGLEPVRSGTFRGYAGVTLRQPAL